MKRAIIVEKDRDTCEVLRAIMVGGLGWEVDCAQSIDEAWALLKYRKYDLFVLDHFLCKYDNGLDLLSVPGSSILVMTTLGARCGDFDNANLKVLPKPFQLDDFISAVQ